MSSVTFADVVHHAITLSRDDEAESLVLDLIDTPWVQRLRDVSQTANTRLVYMFSEHSRFGHCLGVAYLALSLLRRLEQHFGSRIRPYRAAVGAAALLHDIGHLAPGSHTAFRTWFPEQEDNHEALAVAIMNHDPTLREILDRASPHLRAQIAAILSESSSVPPWTWQIISGGGWNVDRGNWCIVDSILAGVSYGKYNIPALTGSITLTDSDCLAIEENRLDSMMHFAVSRHALYRQVYQHRVLLSADTINTAIARRARAVKHDLPFCDDTMTAVLAMRSPLELTPALAFEMREAWWRYHILQWRHAKDPILADLCDRLINRRLFKSVRLTEKDDPTNLKASARAAVIGAGFDPEYYLHEICTVDVHGGDTQQSLLVKMDDGSLQELVDADPMFRALFRDKGGKHRSWLVLPAEAKALLGRAR
jgi:HD superfamily phosphohydrolase